MTAPTDGEPRPVSLLLDADPAAALSRAPGARRALGRDPFEEFPAPDPLLDWPGPLDPETPNRRSDRLPIGSRPSQASGDYV